MITIAFLRLTGNLAAGDQDYRLLGAFLGHAASDERIQGGAVDAGFVRFVVLARFRLALGFIRSPLLSLDLVQPGLLDCFGLALDGL